ncbi:hypothetical protein BDZ89DRAFT_1063445 [Hymenopellis radicata]|nr:hypothetical protein BDZ89DRAFT_1063445 [Hymenopellis radicata]
MGQFDQSLGALLIGSWFNAMFYMLELQQAYTYFTTYRRDPKLIKGVVTFSLVVDTLGTANNCACIYLYTITHWGDTPYLLVQNWAVPSYVILSGISACTVQLFLAYRFWSLSKNVYITPFLALFSLASLAGAIANGITVVQHSTYAERNFNIKTVTIWLVASAVADISIACALVWRLQRANTTLRQTKTLIHRLTFMAIRTGSVTTTLATICLILYLINTESNITVGFGFCIGRVYSLTMLFNLTTRTKGRHTDLNTTEPGSSQREGENRYSLRDINNTDMGVISVHRTAIVRIDGEEDPGYYPTKTPSESADRVDRKNDLTV